MIVEVRTYRVKPGHRDEFIRFFEAQAIPAMQSYGIRVYGPLQDIENPNKFVWLRGFPSLEERDQMKAAFYGGKVWTDEQEALATPMLYSWDFTLCETSPGAVGI